MGDDLAVGARHVIPARELEWTFGPSGGPGGQHANRSNTRAELRFDLGASEVFGPEVKERMLARLAHHGGVVTVIADESRSQYRNRSIARKRLAERLRSAMVPAPTRRATRPSRAQREKRLADKHRRSERKRLRRPPEQD